MVKADGSVSIHADDRAYKPLNWMSPPCRLEEAPGVWRVVNKAGEELRITIEEILHDTSTSWGSIPGLVKDGVEAHLQELLAAAPQTLGAGLHAGPPRVHDRDRPGRPALPGRATGATVAVEIKRRGEIDGVEQLTRYLELLNRDPLLAPVTGIFAAQEIKPQARVLAEDRGIRCVVARLRRAARHRARRTDAVLRRVLGGPAEIAAVAYQLRDASAMSASCFGARGRRSSRQQRRRRGAW